MEQTYQPQPPHSSASSLPVAEPGVSDYGEPQHHSPTRTGGVVGSMKDFAHMTYRKFTTHKGLIGDFDYAYLFTPSVPFMKRRARPAVFFSINSDMPVMLGVLLGLQHALAMVAGLVTPPLLLANMVYLDEDLTQYLVSVSLIVAGVLSVIQIRRLHIYKTKYYIGTGLISVLGVSFGTVSVAAGAFPQMYANGFCPTAEDGTKLPCPDAYGALLGTQLVCALLEVLLSFTPPRILQRMFPPIVCGPVVLLIGISLIGTGLEDFAGGSTCYSPRSMCPSEGAPMAAMWGHPRFIGLGFLVVVTIIICEKWGAPIMKSCAVIVGLLVGCIVAAACGYFDRTNIDKAPVVTFMWVHTFKLSVYGPLVLPMLAVFIVCMMQTIGDVTASCDVSRVAVEGEEYETRIQGGVLADGVASIIAGLMTIPPMSTFAQNNGIIALTQCANRVAGYWCCFFLIVMGVFAKFAAALVAIPKPVLGGMTTFLFTSVAVSGMAIVAKTPFSRRDRFILTVSLMFGFGSILIPTWFSYVFTYDGDNTSLKGFLDAIVLVVETSYAICGIIGVFLNLFLPQEADGKDTADETTEELTGVVVETAESSANSQRYTEKIV